LNGKLRTFLRGSAPADSSTVEAVVPSRGSRKVKLIREVSLALAIYGIIAWAYVGICALVQPSSLALPLTHLLPGLREDTSGVLSFIASFLGFISYRMTRQE
jgi:hypothetical protein